MGVLAILAVLVVSLGLPLGVGFARWLREQRRFHGQLRQQHKRLRHIHAMLDEVERRTPTRRLGA